jgi:hypothetical protein
MLKPTRPSSEADAPSTPRAYHCQCGRQVFFRNSVCLACRTPLGYVAARMALYPLQPGPEEGTWQVHGTDDPQAGASYRRCGNFDTPAACNWLGAADGGPAGPGLCEACRLNRTIPDLTLPENHVLWMRMEKAKRRLVSQLLGLGLPVLSKVSEDAGRGLAYDFLRSVPSQPRVMTGHENGIIAIDLEEADDAVRERARTQMGEPYRTLLGHFRHEVGHYYWDRLVAGTPWLGPCRELFGDERVDYAAALRTHYDQGPPADWPQRFVSAYASTHPWEDWAETWAHCLHIRDTLDTASSYGIQAHQIDIEAEPFVPGDLWDPQDPLGPKFLDTIRSWIEITGVMNEMSHAMGLHDFYPFVLPRPAVAKLHFIHCVVSGGAPPAG